MSTGSRSALREVVSPHTFFEALGVRYAGPIDGHDLSQMEQSFANAATWPGPIVVHVLTQKGRGYAPAEDDEIQRLHDVGAAPRTAAVSITGSSEAKGSTTPRATGARRAVRDAGRGGAHEHRGVHPCRSSARRRRAPTWSPSPPRCPDRPASLPFQARFPDRFFDVGIAEQHEVTMAAGLAMGGLHPVVARLLDLLLSGVRPGESRRRPP